MHRRNISDRVDGSQVNEFVGDNECLAIIVVKLCRFELTGGSPNRHCSETKFYKKSCIGRLHKLTRSVVDAIIC